MRLDKFLSDNGQLSYSRKDIKQMIKAGRVILNEHVCTQAQQTLDPESDTVYLDGQLIEAFSFSYFMLHKPQGMVCDRNNAHYPNVFDHIDFKHTKHPLQVAGRLDQDTTGLVLLSNDGQWLHKVSSGKLDKQKVYLLELAIAIQPEALEALKTGVLLHGEDKPSKAHAVHIINSHRIELIITEGKYHQVKRMLAAVGNKVTALHRTRIANIELDATLQAGQYRMLSEAEIQAINT